ncbi:MULTISPECIES: serine/threonine-protein kinase [Clostridium]|uniref:Serine/threonine-protein kinase n=1 Tax=Clostridium lapidicellarium TaxID=3240931 RepID=A0ABV4DT92_9CLOT
MVITDTSLKFEKIRDIGGEGRNSKVYLAHDLQLDTDIVVKEIPKSQFSDENEYFSEARKLYQNQHPNIVEIQYACEKDGNVYLSMPCYSKGSINKLISKKFLTVREIIKYSLDFLCGIHYMHTKGLIHFDIKPTNILINDSNKAVITDFGLAKYIDSSGLAEQLYFYNTHRPPEAFKQTKLTIESDIYQIGVTLYRMCNGNLIFKNQFKALHLEKCSTDAEKWNKLADNIQKQKFPDRKQYLPHIPNKLRKIINKAMSADINKRYSNVLQVMNDLSCIDKSLDWHYNINKNIGSESWKLDQENHTKIISLNQIGNTFNIVGQKIMKETGNSTKINKWCKKNIQNKEEALKEVNYFIEHA